MPNFFVHLRRVGDGLSNLLRGEDNVAKSPAQARWQRDSDRPFAQAQTTAQSG